MMNGERHPGEVVPAVSVRSVSHRYGTRTALDDVSLTVRPGEIYGLLGPNGGGKTTLFKVLSTLVPLQAGTATLFGHDVVTAAAKARSAFGVVFQAPGLDRMLTVRENLEHHGHLYGLGGGVLRGRIDEVLGQFELADRALDRVAELSGGLKRRVEIAKALLPRPRLLLMDEPSAGIDPGIRHELWRDLRRLRDESGVAILLTTHLFEEASECDRIGILDSGRLVAEGSPHALRSALGSNILSLVVEDSSSIRARLEVMSGCRVQVRGESLRIELAPPVDGAGLVREIIQEFGPRIRDLRMSVPTLEDVYIRKTGRAWEDAA